MGHVVHYRSTAGESRLEDVSSMEAAVDLIERLRNEDGVEDVRLFKEVPLKVRTYYKVVVDDDHENEQPEVPEVAEPVAVSAPAPEPVSGEPPPGAMNLAPPPAAVATAPAPATEEADDEPRRASLFNRG